LLQRTTKTRSTISPAWCTLGFVRHLTRRPFHMSLEAHLAELQRRHRALEDEINEARAHPSIDDLKIVELKRRKLLVKDEMTRLRQDAFVH
jgi:hypothetical protein